jgi:hypothetical protein
MTVRFNAEAEAELEAAAERYESERVGLGEKSRAAVQDGIVRIAYNSVEFELLFFVAAGATDPAAYPDAIPVLDHLSDTRRQCLDPRHCSR